MIQKQSPFTFKGIFQLGQFEEKAFSRLFDALVHPFLSGVFGSAASLFGNHLTTLLILMYFKLNIRSLLVLEFGAGKVHPL